MGYASFKDSARKTASDKILRDKAFNAAKNPKYAGYQKRSCIYDLYFFDKNSTGSGIKNETKQNEQLSEDLFQPIIRKFEKRKVCSSFKVNI